MSSYIFNPTCNLNEITPGYYVCHCSNIHILCVLFIYLHGQMQTDRDIILNRTNRQMHNHTDRQSHRQTDRQMHNHTDRQRLKQKTDMYRSSLVLYSVRHLWQLIWWHPFQVRYAATAAGHSSVEAVTGTQSSQEPSFYFILYWTVYNVQCTVFSQYTGQKIEMYRYLGIFNQR